MTLLQHFAELRRRILWTALVFVLSAVVGWYVAPILQEFLTDPLMNVWGDATLLYTGVTDGLMIRFSLAILFAIFMSLPVGLWHFWAFVSPGLHKKERGIIFPILILSPLLFVLGAGFAFYVLFPTVFRFFIELNLSSPVPSIVMPVARDYLSFSIGLLKVFGIAFQLPLVMVLLNRLGVLDRKTAVSMRRYAIVGIVIVAAVLTPPDIVSQLLLALPMWLLFEGSILFMRRDNA